MVFPSPISTITITLVSIVADADAAAERKKQVETGLEHTRIQASVEAIVKPAGQSVTDLIHERSRDCDLVLLGLPVKLPLTAATNAVIFALLGTAVFGSWQRRVYRRRWFGG